MSARSPSMRTERFLIASGAGAEEVFVPLRRRVPALILHEAAVAAEVRRQRPSAMRAVRNKLCRHGHFGRFRRSKCAIRRNCIALRSDHVLDNLPVIERLRATRLAALEQPVVSLRVEQAVLVKSGFLKAVIHIRCEGQSNPCPSQAKAVFHRRASAHSDNG